MARSGRRLVIGGSGNLSGDDSLAETGGRGEVRKFTPISEQEQAAAAAAIQQGNIKAAEEATRAGTASSTYVIDTGGDGVDGPGPSGDAPSSTGAGGGPGPGAGGSNPSGEGQGGPDSTSDSSGPGDGPDFKRGGLVGKGGGTVEENEFVLPAGAVKKYPRAVLEALRHGRAVVTPHKVAKSMPKRRLVG